MWRIVLESSKSARYRWFPTVEVCDKCQFSDLESQPNPWTYTLEVLEGRVDSCVPCIREGIVVGIGQTSMFNQVFKVTVRSSSPRLHSSRSQLVFAQHESYGTTYDVAANELARRRINSLCSET